MEQTNDRSFGNTRLVMWEFVLMFVSYFFTGSWNTIGGMLGHILAISGTHFLIWADSQRSIDFLSHIEVKISEYTPIVVDYISTKIDQLKGFLITSGLVDRLPECLKLRLTTPHTEHLKTT